MTQITLDELKKLEKSEGILIGTERTMKALKSGKLKKIILASNCNNQSEKVLRHYAEIGKVEVIKCSYKNDELGTIFKKPFSISIIGLKV